MAAVVDATHPFAERMSWSAFEACAIAGTKLLRLERPPFARDPAIDWREVAHARRGRGAPARAPAAACSSRPAARGSRRFVPVAGAFFLVRCVDPPDPAALPPDHAVLLDRGPYDIGGELAVIDRHALDVLVTKDSGGAMTQAKLDAARERGLPVIVVARPARPAAETVRSVEQALAWLADHAG